MKTPRYVFVLCCSRSGSTLLRFVLDSHAEVWCPPELEIASLCRSLRRTLSVLNSNLAGSQDDEAKKRTNAQAREIISGIIEPRLSANNKSVCCEKAVITVDHVDMLNSVFPDAKFICLYRNCMDVVHSSIERCRYGWSGFGTTEYIRNKPENIVDALIDYWIDKTSTSMEFERLNPEKCIRVKFESLVFYPEKTVEGLFQFLGLNVSDDLVKSVFTTCHQYGPGDQKVWVTNRFDASNVGKGFDIRRGLISTPQLRRMNETLAKLGYPEVGDAWGIGESPFRPADVPVQERQGMGGTRELFESRVSNRVSKNGSAFGLDRSIQFRIGDLDESWLVDLSNRKVCRADGDGDGSYVFGMDSDVLLGIANGNLNPFIALETGKIKFLSGPPDLGQIRQICALLSPDLHQDRLSQPPPTYQSRS